MFSSGGGVRWCCCCGGGGIANGATQGRESASLKLSADGDVAGKKLGEGDGSGRSGWTGWRPRGRKCIRSKWLVTQDRCTNAEEGEEGGGGEDSGRRRRRSRGGKSQSRLKCGVRDRERYRQGKARQAEVGMGTGCGRQLRTRLLTSSALASSLASWKSRTSRLVHAANGKQTGCRRRLGADDGSNRLGLSTQRNGYP